MSPCRSGQGEPPVHLAWLATHGPATVTQCPGGGGGGDSRPASYPEDVHQVGSHSVPGGWEMTWVEDKKEGLVEERHQYLSKYNGIVCRSFTQVGEIVFWPFDDHTLRKMPVLVSVLKKLIVNIIVVIKFPV